MMILQLNDGARVAYIQDEAEINAQPPEFCVYYVKANDVKTVEKLREHNFIFADRLMNVEIALSDWQPGYYIRDRCSFRCEISEHWPIEEIYRMAEDEFRTDRRFAVSLSQPDEKRKKELIYQYMCQLKEDHYMATFCYKEKELAGFNLWKVENDAGTILLGAVAKNFRGGVSIYLYEATLLAMKETGAEKLSNRVSTSNLAAIKMHMALGRNRKLFKITGFEDQYIKEENK